ncbi:peptidoglycan/xylan/chitin deacetylase (PgdA/CDA1 family) [Virgibacillus natechei]|uniref:Peptidoglycan/xylan/chitin deacetylase (PgdA/CDA1 family) n=1 Tax=Virgibacillus natechei TaxID=1216297 RepID=A0ABS4IBD9_9BACI|nr:polysaccharide deacetylase family protein [Virgibacillus natechei]MBP1968242.1 peptidoglycan/xylan/chitin deacetylase (PgdA/CDA1 family) [Virgibacillus natechei]UZD14487.1 polysaccharide deacetylase family protein [Virgibacillus natechei]
MKRSLFYITIALLFVLSACSGNDEPAGGEADSASPNEQKNSEEQVENDNQENNTEEDVEETEEVVESEEAAAETEEPEYEVSENWSVVPIDDASNEEVVLLTIDDAPDEYGLEMAKTLDQLEANAIFFVNGHFLDTPEKEEMLREIDDMGFAIGNHTYSHVTLPEETEEVQKEEIVDLSDRVEEIIGKRPEFFRAPHGANTEYSTQIAEDEGMTVMNWSYGYDWEQDYMDSNALAEIMVQTELLSNGSNLLMHDREWTAEALEDIVDGLRDEGYEIIDPDLIQKPE